MGELTKGNNMQNPQANLLNGLTQKRRAISYKVYQEEASILERGNNTQNKEQEQNISDESTIPNYDFSNLKIKAFKKLVEAKEKNDPDLRYVAIQELGCAKLFEITDLASELIRDPNFLPDLVEDPNEVTSSRERYNQDLVNLKKDIPEFLKNKAGNENEQTLCALASLLTYCGILPTYTLKAETINEIYSARMDLITKLFTDPHYEELHKRIESLEFASTEEKNAFWRDIHKNPDILHHSLLEIYSTRKSKTPTTVISRRKNIVSILEKCIRKNPTMVQTAQDKAIEYVLLSQHLKNLENDLIRLNASQNKISRLEKIAQIKTQIEKTKPKLKILNKDMQQIRGIFMSEIKDLFGITLISENEDSGTVFDAETASAHIEAFHHEHVKFFTEIAESIDQKYGTILKSRLNGVINRFHSVEDKRDKIAQVSDPYNDIIKEMLDRLIADEGLLNKLLKGKLNPVHRNILNQIYNAKNAGWTIVDVSDYIGVYKVNQDNKPAHSGLQIQFVDSKKGFEIQTKDRTIYNSSTKGYGSHEGYKLDTTSHSTTQMMHGLGLSVIELMHPELKNRISFIRPSKS